MSDTGTISETIGDAGHFVRRSGLFIAGKNVIELVGGRAFMQGIRAVANGALPGVGAMLAIGGISALSASLTQMDYNHRDKKIKDTYKDELEALNRSNPGAPVQNRVIDEAVSQNKRQRNFGIALSVIASLAAFALVLTVFPGEAAFFSVATIAKGAIGLLAYNAVKTPLHMVGDKLFGLHSETTHDRIVSLKRGVEQGKHLTREQVFEVFIHANPELDEFIANNNARGAHFAKLPEADKDAVMEQWGPAINLRGLTDDINSGKVKASELAFAVNGQISGLRRAGHEEKPEPKALEKVMQTCVDMVKSLSERKKPELSAEPSLAPVSATPLKTTPVTNPTTALPEYVQETPIAHFVNSLKLAKGNPNMTHVERLAQANSAQLAGPRFPS